MAVDEKPSSISGKVSEIFLTAGTAFSRLGEMSLQLHGAVEEVNSPRWTDDELNQLRDAIDRFSADLTMISENMKTKTMAQIRMDLKRRVVDDELDSIKTPADLLAPPVVDPKKKKISGRSLQRPLGTLDPQLLPPPSRRSTSAQNRNKSSGSAARKSASVPKSGSARRPVSGAAKNTPKVILPDAERLSEARRILRESDRLSMDLSPIRPALPPVPEPKVVKFSSAAPGATGITPSRNITLPKAKLASSIKIITAPAGRPPVGISSHSRTLTIAKPSIPVGVRMVPVSSSAGTGPQYPGSSHYVDEYDDSEEDDYYEDDLDQFDDFGDEVYDDDEVQQNH